MKIISEVNGEKFNVEINRAGDAVFAEINGRKYELEATQPETNIWLLKHGGKVYECYVSDKGVVNIGNDRFEVKIIDPKRLRGSEHSDAHTDGIAEIRTAMPGKIVKILVEIGAEVIAGDGVIVVEAMKMQNEMKAPKDGIVKEIRFAAGDNVNAGDILLVVE